MKKPPEFESLGEIGGGKAVRKSGGAVRSSAQNLYYAGYKCEKKSHFSPYFSIAKNVMV